VMPDDAPRIKIENTKALGAEVVLYKRHTESREQISADIAAKTGAVMVPPYDDAAIMAGQGTAGLELCEQAAALGLTPDVVIAPCSGGGLMAGVATAVKHRFPNAAVFSAEPATCNDLERSLVAGKRIANAPGSTSICDALMSPQPGVLTFPVHQALLAGGLSASDGDILRAMKFALTRMKLVIEPGGAASLACALLSRDKFRGRTVAIVASGGNADPETVKQALESEDFALA
jgi:threonine dehydratase